MKETAVNTELSALELLEKENIRIYTVLFVCTGNTCRSPMASAVYSHLFRGKDVQSFSRGIMADGTGITKEAADALEAEGILSGPGNNYREHISANISQKDIENSDIVVCLSGTHMNILMSAFPQYASKFVSFPVSVPDPYGKGPAEYRDCLRNIKSQIKSMFDGTGRYAGK